MFFLLKIYEPPHTMITFVGFKGLFKFGAIITWYENNVENL